MSNRRNGPKKTSTARPQTKIQEFARGIVDLALEQAEIRHKDLQHSAIFQACEVPSCRKVRDQAVRLFDVIKGFAVAENHERLQTTRRMVNRFTLTGHGPVFAPMTSSDKSHSVRPDKRQAALAVGPSPRQLAAWAQRRSQPEVRSNLTREALDLIG